MYFKKIVISFLLFWLSVNVEELKKAYPDVDFDKPLEKDVPEQLFCSTCEAEMNKSSPVNETDNGVERTSQTLGGRLTTLKFQFLQKTKFLKIYSSAELADAEIADDDLNKEVKKSVKQITKVFSLRRIR